MNSILLSEGDGRVELDGHRAGPDRLRGRLGLESRRVAGRAGLHPRDDRRGAVLAGALPAGDDRERAARGATAAAATLRRRSGRRRHGGIALVRRPSHARRLLTAIRSTLTAPSLPCYNRSAKSPSESKNSHYITPDVAARRSLFLRNRRAAPRANSRSNLCS